MFCRKGLEIAVTEMLLAVCDPNHGYNEQEQDILYLQNLRSPNWLSKLNASVPEIINLMIINSAALENHGCNIPATEYLRQLLKNSNQKMTRLSCTLH